MAPKLTTTAKKKKSADRLKMNLKFSVRYITDLLKSHNDLVDDTYRKNLNTLVKATFFRLKRNCHAVETIRALHI